MPGDALAVELFVNGFSAGKQELHSVAPALAGGDTWAEFRVQYAPGNLTAVAYDQAGAVAAQDTRLTSGEAAKIELTIDVPSPLTGTGAMAQLAGNL